MLEQDAKVVSDKIQEKAHEIYLTLVRNVPLTDEILPMLNQAKSAIHGAVVSGYLLAVGEKQK